MPDLSSPIRALAGHIAVADAAMKFSAQYLIAGAAVLLAIAWLTGREGLRACLAAGSAGLVAVGISGLIGDLWDRPRPFVAGHFAPLISHGVDASFPSDHVAALAAVATALWFSSRRLGIAGWVLAAIVGFARVYVGVHYVSDIAGGAVLGAATGWAAWWITGLAAPWIAKCDDILRRMHLRPHIV